MKRLKGFFKNTRVGRTIGGLVRETAQTVPFLGTIVTNFKTDTIENPAGKIKLSKWDIYRLLIGLAIGYVLYKGILSLEQVEFIMTIINSFGADAVAQMILLIL